MNFERQSTFEFLFSSPKQNPRRKCREESGGNITQLSLKSKMRGTAPPGQCPAVGDGEKYFTTVDGTDVVKIFFVVKGGAK